MATDDLIRERLLDALEPVDEAAAWATIRQRAAAADRRRRRRPLAAAACVVLVALVGGAVALLRQDDPADVEAGPAETIPLSPPDTWRILAEGPLSARSGASAVWTGQEMLVAGGTEATPCPPDADCHYVDGRLDDGAAYDPATDTWRPIATAPRPFEAAETIWTGDVMLVFVGSFPGGDDPALLGYDPDADEWTERDTPPASDPHPLWTGSVAVDVAGYNSSGEADWTYDPEADSWQELPTDPLGCGEDRQGAWADDRLVVFWKACTTNRNSIEPSLYYGASVFDMASGLWERLPDSGVAGWGPWWAVGDRLISIEVGAIDGGEVNPFDRPYELGGIFDLARGVWEPLPQPSADVAAVEAGVGFEGVAGPWIVSGRRMFAPSTGAWRPIPVPPAGTGTDPVAVWTGREIIHWGGTNADSTGHVATGAAYTPPAPG